MKPKILIATSSFGELEPSLIQNLNKEFECVFNTTGRKLKTQELMSLLTDVSGVIAGTEIYSSQVLESAKNLKLAQRKAYRESLVNKVVKAESSKRTKTSSSDDFIAYSLPSKGANLYSPLKLVLIK